MYRRFWIICLVIGAALLVLSGLGLSSLRLHERSLRAERQGQFSDVAEQVRMDVKTKLDDFLQIEQERPYTDYQYDYIPETLNAIEALVRSPLADSLTHGMAFGHFQIDAQGNIMTPYVRPGLPAQEMGPVLAAYLDTVKTKVLNSLNGPGIARVHLPELGITEEAVMMDEEQRQQLAFQRFDAAAQALPEQDVRQQQQPGRQQQQPTQQQRLQAAPERQMAQQRAANQSQIYNIESIQQSQFPKTAILTRGNFDRNISNTQSQMTAAAGDMGIPKGMDEADTDIQGNIPQDRRQSAAATVQIRIEPFVPLVIRDGTDSETVFPGEIFLVRHVQIEGVHLLQGFRLNETELAEQVEESARRLLREGMAAELNQTLHPDTAHAAILDFGFGELVLNLFEIDPGWIAVRVARLNAWMATILAVVWLAVLLALLALWRNLCEQDKLAHKKDDFISAVSHELRTPLTSIRMYTEMLEKNWVKDETKRLEYYGTMRQETERLTRLVENVLDFSRLQRGKKKLEFTIGDVNECIANVVEMMQPCAERMGFVIETELSSIEPFAFDRDAVMQIAINLIDNAFKYAKEAHEKRIFIRTHSVNGAAVIEVEDHGPGVPRSQQKKIFEAFYRCGDEATRQCVGTGLGLALVKSFAEAHRGGVEILNAKPAGALFRVRIAR